MKKMKPSPELEYDPDTRDDDIDSNWLRNARRLLQKSGTSYKHLAGQHNQKRHGYRYGGAPKPEQARELVRAGLWEDYLARARAYAGKGARPVPTEAEYKSAQQVIAAERKRYANILKDVDKAQAVVDKNSAVLSKHVKIQDKINAERHKAQVLAQKILAMEDDAQANYSRLSDPLIKKREEAYDAGDYTTAGALMKKLNNLFDARAKIYGALGGNGYYYNHKGEKVSISVHPLRKQMDKANDAVQALLDQKKKMPQFDMSNDSWDRLANAQSTARMAANEYVKYTAGARRTAMAYLRNEAQKIRSEFLAMDNKARTQSLAKMKDELSALEARKEQERKNSDGDAWDFQLGQQIYSLRNKIERIESGGAADNAVRMSLSDRIKVPDDKRIQIKAKYDDPVDDGTFGARGFDKDWARSNRERGVDSFSSYVVRNSLVERATIGIRNADKAKGGGRAYQSSGNIFLFYHSNTSSVVHELGHAVEHHDPGILAESLRFKQRRTGNDMLEKMATVTGDSSYGDREVTQKDRFLDAYIGKNYGTRATEVLSMGIEMFYTDPFKLMRLDPDMFGYIYAAVRLGEE